MFYDEEMILDFRLNYLNNYVDKFVVVESSYTHSGKKRELIFDIKKYSKFNRPIYYECGVFIPKEDSTKVESYFETFKKLDLLQ